MLTSDTVKDTTQPITQRLSSFYPSDISDLVWLDATDNDNITITSGRVSGIADKLGSGAEWVHATASRQPILSTDEGSQTLYFDGARHLIGNAAAEAIFNGASGASILVVGKRDDETDEEVLFYDSSNGSASVARFLFSLTASNIKISAKKNQADTTDTLAGGYYDADNFHSYGATVSKTDRRARLYRGAFKATEESGTFTTSTDNFEAADSQVSSLGSAGGLNWFTGHISQVFLLPREMTQQEMFSLVSFADAYTKRQTRTNRLVVVAGDSIFYNSYLTAAARYDRKLHNELASASTFVVNTAVDGRTLATMNTNIAEVTNQFANAYAGVQRVLMHDGGSNDIATDAQSTEQAQARMQTYHDNIKTTYPDAKICWSTLIARTNDSITNNLRSFNDAVIAAQETLKIDAIALTGDDTAFDGSPDAATDTGNVTNYTDGVHPTATGVLLMVPYGATAINSLAV